jgi:nitrogen regulatory protein P-II 1
MKKIEAVILPLQLDAVHSELRRLGIRGGLTMGEVRHGDNHIGAPSTEKGNTGAFGPRIKLELMVDDCQVEKAVNAILRHARPESDEDGGQIAVLEVNEVTRIGRTAHQTSDPL